MQKFFRKLSHRQGDSQVNQESKKVTEKTIELYKPDLFIESVETLVRVDGLLSGWGYVRKERFNATPTYRYTYED